VERVALYFTLLRKQYDQLSEAQRLTEKCVNPEVVGGVVGRYMRNGRPNARDRVRMDAYKSISSIMAQI
jgi:hypothetical protein